MISHWLQEVVSVLLIGQGEIFLLPAGNAGCSERYVPESSLFILSEGCFFLNSFSQTLFGNRVIAVQLVKMRSLE